MASKLVPVSERFWDKVQKTDSCWLWMAAIGNKKKLHYGVIWIGGRDGRNVAAHRVAYELTYGPIPVGVRVLHKCDNPRCVRPDHLFLGSHLDNMADMVLKGRSTTGDRHWSRTRPDVRPRGEQNGNSKLTREQAEAIRETYLAGGGSLSSLARQFSVSKKTVLNIVHGKIWT